MKTQSAAIALGLAMYTAVSSASPFDTRKIDFQLTGTVLDADTKQPIDGAYVIASYKVRRSGMAATANFCVELRGMYTGPDGKYRFPILRLDGLNPFATTAIKPGYFWKDTIYPDSDLWRKQNAQAYGGRDIYLKRQDPAEPDWRLSNGEERCNDAPTREAAAAGVEFLKIKLAEYQRYRASEQGLDSVKSSIRRLEALPLERPTPRSD